MRATLIDVLLMSRKQKGKAYSGLVKIRQNQKKKNREICRGNLLLVGFVCVTQSEMRTIAFASAPSSTVCWAFGQITIFTGC